ncbi:hypothetical protein FRC12_007653 [Ceratobasidium sp. 428]|nr:hypothetical protein FRC12_007653 [Ceratobasidium sp. 428]
MAACYKTVTSFTLSLLPFGLRNRSLDPICPFRNPDQPLLRVSYLWLRTPQKPRLPPRSARSHELACPVCSIAVHRVLSIFSHKFGLREEGTRTETRRVG